MSRPRDGGQRGRWPRQRHRRPRPARPRLTLSGKSRLSAFLVHPAEHRGDFFRVLQETAHSQTAVMTVAPGQDAGPEESHAGDQIVYVVEGQAELRVGSERLTAGPGALVLIPAGTRHHVRNSGTAPLFFLTVYAPPAY